MKKIITFISATIFLMSSTLFAGDAIKVLNNKKYNVSRVDGQIAYLLALHENFLDQMFSSANRNFSSIDKIGRGFFKYVDFINDDTAQNFFKNIVANIESGQAPAIRGGVVQISYMSYTNINGVVKGVQYQYVSDGKKITLVKQTNNNGMLLKAMYEYDATGRLLNVKEFNGNNLINQKQHRLII